MTAKTRREIENRIPMDFRNASKQPWECSSYEEFLASLPEEELTAIEGYQLASEQE